MNAPVKLVIFDVDGTLVDSQGAILGAMNAAFDAVGLAAPTRQEVLAIVGLSLDRAMFQLVPELPGADRARLVEGYKAAYHAQRVAEGSTLGSPLYPGAVEVLEQLQGRPDVLLGIATGKSRRGLDALISGHGLDGVFVTTQVADDHPSKPHPSMIETALQETGVMADQAVMIGDTSFDLEMAAAARVRGIGVGWGYHPRAALQSRAACVIDSFEALPEALEQLWIDAT